MPKYQAPIKTILTTLALIVFGFLFAFDMTAAATLTRPPNNLDLVGYWPMDEGTGAVVGDMSGNGNHGAINGNPQWTSGKRGGAMEFDGDGDYVDAGNTGIDLESDLSVSTWLKFDTVSVERVAIGFGYSATNSRLSIGHYSDGKARVLFRQDNGTNVVNSFQFGSELDDNQFHQIVFVFSPSTNAYSVYVDGLNKEQSNPAAFTSISSDKMVIGGQYVAGVITPQFIGLIDDVRIYSRALTAAEVSDLYNSGAAKLGVAPKGPASESLVGHWTFDGKDMLQNVADVSGQGNHGDLEGQTSTTTAIGVIGQALEFDGVDDYVTRTTFSGANATEESFAFWMYANGTQNSLTGFVTSTKLNPLVFANGGTNMRYNIYDTWFTKAIDITDPTAFPLNEWVHYAGTWDANGGTLYRNGTLVGTDATGTSTYALLDTNIYIGSDRAIASRYFKGLMDDVRIYSKALSAQEVSDLYNATKGSKANVTNQGQGTSLGTGLVGHWTFDGKDMYQNVADVSGNGNHGDLEGQTSTTTAIGVIGQALEFDGVNDYVISSSLDDDLPNVAGQQFSISSWSIASATDSGIFGFNTYPSIRYYSALRFCQNSTTCSNTTSVSFNEWNHVVLTYDSSRYIIYVNNVIVLNTSNIQADLGNLPSGYIFFIGASSPSNYRFLGKIDDVRIYSRALTAEEVYRLYSMGK